MASRTQWTWVEQSLGVGDVQGSLACCNSWGCKQSNRIEQLNCAWDGEKCPNSASGLGATCAPRPSKMHMETLHTVFFFLIFIYLALPSLSCGTWDLRSSLQHTGSFSCSTWDLVPGPGLKPRPPALWAQS